MLSNLTLSDVLARGVSFSPHEAVAIAQTLIDNDWTDVDLDGALGPPSLDNVVLQADGSVRCRGCAITPAVSEIAILLEAMLPRRPGVKASGALRYAIARALLEVDAPPFDSLADLSDALRRQENGDRRTVVRELFARAAAAAPDQPLAIPERRRAGTHASELRRRLREADEELFRRMEPAAAVTPPLRLVNEPPALHRVPEPSPPAYDDRGTSDRRDRRQTSIGAWILGGCAAAMLAFAAGYVTIDRLQSPGGREVVARPSTAAAPDDRRSSTPLSETDRASDPAAASPPATHDASILERSRGERDGSAPAVRGARVDAAPRRAVVRAAARDAGPMFSPAFASNGTALFFHTGRTADARSAIEATDLGADALHVMTIVDDGSRNYHVQPSPDGARVAFDSDRDGERGVYVANRDGSGVRRVSGAGYAAVPTWSPDGTHLAFVRAERDHPRVWNLWLLRLDSGETRRLTRFSYGQTWGASWFAEGRRVAYTHEDRLFVHDLATDSIRDYSSPVRGRLMRTPAVSPDGGHVVFQVARSGAWLVDLRDGSMRCILEDPTAEEFAWSPDGRRVAFHSRRDGQWGIWLMAGSW